MKKDVEEFAIFENELELFNRRYNGFPYWMYLRFIVCESLFGERHTVEKRISGLNQVGICRRIFFSILDIYKDIRTLFFGKKYDYLVFRQNKLKDFFFDTWNMPNDKKSITFYAEERLQTYKIKDHYLGLPRIIKGIKKRILNLKHSYQYDDEERFFLKNLEIILKKKYGQCISWSQMEVIIIDAIETHKVYRMYYKRLFDKIKCKAIITIVYYQQVLFPAYEVAKEKGIPVLELQHGVVNNHISYLFENVENCNCIIPDYLLTFGEIHNKWIKLPKGSKAIAIGFPGQEKALEKYKNIIPDKNTVVIYPEPYIEYEKVIDEFITRYEKQFNILIKLHPLQFGYVEEFFPLLSKNDKAVFIDNQDKDIYYWLKFAKHHVMSSTTVGLEAMAYDHCNICIIETAPHEQIQCLLDWGLARGFSSAEELLALIENPIANKPEQKAIRDQLWKKNAKRNMEYFFEHFLE